MILKKLKIAKLDKGDLDKLFTTPILEDNSYLAILGYLERSLKELGYGFYSNVFENEGRAIKLGKYRDVCWYQFGEYVMKHKNKHYPKVYRIQAFPEQEYYLAEMEILKPLRYSLKYMMEEYPLAYELMKENDEKKMVNLILEESQDPIAKALSPFVKLKNCRLDLHSDNFMWRGRILVINDPVSLDN